MHTRAKLFVPCAALPIGGFPDFIVLCRPCTLSCSCELDLQPVRSCEHVEYLYPCAGISDGESSHCEGFYVMPEQHVALATLLAHKCCKK